jgi:hypothetical protein
MDCGTPPKKLNARTWPSQKTSVVSAGVADHEAGVRVRRVKSEEVDLALHAADDADGFAKVDLGMSRRMLQRHKHLLSPMTPAGDVILHNRKAAREAVLVPETLEDPLRRMLLFPRARLVVEENPVDHRDERIKLRLGRRLCAHPCERRRDFSRPCGEIRSS